MKQEYIPTLIDVTRSKTNIERKSFMFVVQNQGAVSI